MPWPYKKSVLGCCLLCHDKEKTEDDPATVYPIITYYGGISWHKDCKPSEKLERRIKYIKWAMKRKKSTGRVAAKRAVRTPKLKPSEAAKREAVTGVYIKNKRMHKCRVCGVETINWWLCPVHLSQASSNYDLSLIIETGESRHAGARLGG